MSQRITPEIRALVGRKHGPYRVKVEQGAIEKFADAIGDPNPAYRGADAIAPPTFPTTSGQKTPFPICRLISVTWAFTLRKSMRWSGPSVRAMSWMFPSPSWTSPKNRAARAIWSS